VLVFLTSSTQSVSWNWSKAWLPLHRLCPFKTLYIPLYYGWALCTIKLKENGILDDILAKKSKIDWKGKRKGKSPLLSNHDGATLLLVPCAIYIILDSIIIVAEYPGAEYSAEGFCTNLYTNHGCLANWVHGWNRVRVCKIEAPHNAASLGICWEPHPLWANLELWMWMECNVLQPWMGLSSFIGMSWFMTLLLDFVPEK